MLDHTILWFAHGRQLHYKMIFNKKTQSIVKQNVVQMVSGNGPSDESGS